MSAASTVEFFFDCSSPWTYLGFHNIQPMADELGFTIAWRPFLVASRLPFFREAGKRVSNRQGKSEG